MLTLTEASGLIYALTSGLHTGTLRPCRHRFSQGVRLWAELKHVAARTEPIQA